jgi:hypothetical protein
MMGAVVNDGAVEELSGLPHPSLFDGWVSLLPVF